MENNLADLGVIVSEDEVMNYGSESMGLADFMDVDVSDIEANEGGFSRLPIGFYVFSVEAIDVKTINRKSKETGEDLKIPNVSVKCKVDEVVEVMPTEDVVVDPDKLVGRFYFHNVSLPSYDVESYTKAVGRLKALAVKLAPDSELNSMKDILSAIANKTFVGKINHRKYKTKDDSGGEKTGLSEDLELKSIKIN